MSKPNPEVDYVYGFPSYPPYVLIPVAPPSPRRRRSRSCCDGACSAGRLVSAAFILILLTGGVLLAWPRRPVMNIMKATLHDIKLHVEDGVTLDLSLNIVLRITNLNYVGVNYDSVKVNLSYQGDDLGKVNSLGGEVPARSVALVAAVLDLKGLPVLKHMSDLIVDVAHNEIPIETMTVFSGSLKIWKFRPHITAHVRCLVHVDPRERDILKQRFSCSPPF